MVITCQQCSARLQLDDTKIPTRPFTVRCPKCQNIIQAQPPAAPTEPSALSLGETPSLENRRYKPQAAARRKWGGRGALACVAPQRREAIGRALVDADYQVYIAEDTSQAIER